MPRLQVQVIDSPGKSRRQAFDAAAISFGRDPSNQIVLDEPTASRKHGELKYKNDRWVLVNLSPNGTTVQGKRVTRKPQPLNHQDTVWIGDRAAFVVLLPDERGEPKVPMDQAAPTIPLPNADREPAIAVTGIGPSEQAGRSARLANLSLLLGASLVVFLLMLLFLAPLVDKKDSGEVMPREMLATQIEDDIRKPLRVDHADPAAGQRQLEEARELASKWDANPRNLFRAHRAFKQALAYMGESTFPPGPDQLLYLQIENRLVEKVTRRYSEAYQLLRSRQFRKADEAYRALNNDLYPDSTSAIFRSVQEQRKIAAENAKRKG